MIAFPKPREGAEPDSALSGYVGSAEAEKPSGEPAARPLAIDLYCGLGGWSLGLLAEGWDVIGFDIERHQYGAERYPAQLVVQDVLTLHGSQFRMADLIVASPPCQFFSWTAMPWSIAKARAAEVRADPALLEAELALFKACFRIQREACEAAGRHIPMVVENVRGAIPWVGRSRWNYGSFHLWGDVPALMPTVRRYGATDGNKRTGRTMCYPAGSANPEAVKGRTGKLHWQDEPDGRKNDGGSRFAIGSPGQTVTGMNPDGRKLPGFQTASVDGMKAPAGTQWFNDGPRGPDSLASSGSKSSARKAASARIAKIPLPLSRWIARTYKP